ncbi:glycerol-3-phosphate 1-O-acyltransferase PlsY [Enorma burkinafasonensis]|uniref:glycerol-3-phosphate 1-O-acyltransferase PlsY n=1 Tax=Enorma burkinafasonensis TaxID=2590867 RepID=UPI0026EB8FD9|nr:glycerol-3-phosphate 1-O-acyltransferase PlsY [Enorma burkinafasonensis]MCI7731065.1 glycerol-3-phosphate 1-O-acyltransferase PlsY [Enorma burkinafasonensis]
MGHGLDTAIYLELGLMLVSYLICGIPFGKILAKRFAHKDLQQEGSGNIGTTNALRVAGPKVAAITLAFDLLKGTVCMVAAKQVLLGGAWDARVPVDLMVALVALACLYGHIFSPYLHFHGGKGIATGVGILFGFFWPLAIVHLAIFIVLVAITRYVSVGSIVTAAVVPVTVFVAFPHLAPAAIAVWALLGWSVVWAHRANIGRLRAGTESKLSFGSKKEA